VFTNTHFFSSHKYSFAPLFSLVLQLPLEAVFVKGNYKIDKIMGGNIDFGK